MSPSQRKAVETHRKRQQEKGIVRMEISVSECDKSLIKSIAVKLREGSDEADSFRSTLKIALNRPHAMTFKEMLECAPLEVMDLERSKEGWRDIEL
jgi:hypothetical protein